MLNSLTALLDNRLEGFDKNLDASQKALADTQLVKIDETLLDNYRFKKRGNEEKHKHNNKVMVKFRESLNTENLDSAKEKISESMELIKNGQKLIKIADYSEGGWRWNICPIL